MKLRLKGPSARIAEFWGQIFGFERFVMCKQNGWPGDGRWFDRAQSARMSHREGKIAKFKGWFGAVVLGFSFPFILSCSVSFILSCSVGSAGSEALGASVVGIRLLSHAIFSGAQRTQTDGASSPHENKQNGAESEAPSDSEEALRRRIQQLIADLGSPIYQRREEAQRELAEIGSAAYEDILEATSHPDPEIAARARFLVRLIPSQASAEDESPETRELLTYYESLPPEPRRVILRLLARMPRGKGWPTLVRLVRFERRPLWSKYAALELMMAEPMDSAGRRRWAETVRGSLGRSSRPAAQWLSAYLEMRAQPEQTLEQWRQLVAQEEGLLAQPEQTSPLVVASLAAHQAILESDLNRVEAEATFAQLAKRLPGQTPEEISGIVDLGVLFQNRCKLVWAEREFRRAIAAVDLGRSLRARRLLAELLHDQGRNLEAAQVIQELMDALRERRAVVLEAEGMAPSELRARMHYFLACHWKEQQNWEEHLKHLEAAIRDDPEELDSLIARHNFPQATPEFREETATLITQALRSLERQLREVSDPEYQAGLYNQLAWLAANTGGDSDRALEWANKAIEIDPDSGAYQDTLAHVYFQRGELEKAVKTQERAVELSPCSGLIVRQLEVFRNQLAEKQVAQPPQPAQAPKQPTPAP